MHYFTALLIQVEILEILGCSSQDDILYWKSEPGNKLVQIKLNVSLNLTICFSGHGCLLSTPSTYFVFYFFFLQWFRQIMSHRKKLRHWCSKANMSFKRVFRNWASIYWSAIFFLITLFHILVIGQVFSNSVEQFSLLACSKKADAISVILNILSLPP